MPLLAVLAAIVVQICWGLNFSAAKFAMMDFTPLSGLCIRFVVISILLLPFVLRHKKPTRRDLRDFAWLALLINLGHFSLLLVALKMGLNVTSCILAVQLGVPFSCVAAAIFFKDKLGPWRTFGLALAFFGVLLVAVTRNALDHKLAFAVAILAALAWCAGNLFLKVMRPQKVVPLLFWPALFALPGLVLISYCFESAQIPHILAATPRGWVSIAYTSLFSSLVGYGLWNWLLTKYPVSQVVPFTLLLPIFGITAGVLFFHDPFNWHILLGAALTLIGVGIIVVRRPKLFAAEED